MKKIKNNKVRIPRPMGLTHLNIQIHNLASNPQKQEELRNKRATMIIGQYVANGMYYNGVQIPIDQMASYLNIHVTELLMRMNKEFSRIGRFFDGDEGRQLARVSIFGALKGVLETQSKAKSQTHILMADQGQRYVPFLSGELNRAIQNELNSYKPLLDILKLMSDNPATNIFIQNNNPVTQNQYLTPDAALRLIEANSVPSMLTNPNLIPDKEAQLGQIPEVGARFQNLNNIGIKYDGSQNTIEGSAEVVE